MKPRRLRRARNAFHAGEEGLVLNWQQIVALYMPSPVILTTVVLGVFSNNRGLEQVGKRIDDLRNDINKRSDELRDDIGRQIEGINKRIDDTHKRIDELRDDTNRRFDETNKRMDELGERLEARIDRLEARLEHPIARP
jgi:peptidoglycan hydrolase CwlO-like protein